MTKEAVMYYRGLIACHRRAGGADLYGHNVVTHRAHHIMWIDAWWNRITEAIDYEWTSIVEMAEHKEVASYDGVPWTIYSIDDPSVRQDAITEFLAETAKLEVVSPYGGADL